MRAVAWVLWLCLGAALTGCAQRVDAWVRADAVPDQAQGQTRGASYVLLAPPLCDHGPAWPAWEEVRDLLRPALAALGYVPHVAQPRANAPTTAKAGAATAPRESGADAAREAKAGDMRHMRDTASPSAPLPPPPARVGQGSARGQAATPQPSATPGADDVPDVVVRVHWDAQGPFQRYIPVLRSAPCWYGPRWHRHWRGYWPYDPFYPYAYIIEDFHVRRLLVEAVRNTSPTPERAAPLTLTEALLREDDRADPLLWRVQVESLGTLSHAERVLPEMTRAALPWLGRNVRAQVRVRGEDVQAVAVEQ